MLKLILLFFLFSCSVFIQRIETPLVKKKMPESRSQDLSYCPVDKSFQYQIVGTNQNSQAVYLEIIKKLKTPFDFLDHFALWSLMQLSIRPDQSSPTSRLQVLLKHNGKSHYFDFFSEAQADQYPYLYGIEWILRKFGKQRSLEYYARILSIHLGRKLKIGKEFERFLLTNYAAIKANVELAPYYFRGTDVLKESETSPFIDYKKVLNLYRQSSASQRIIVNTFLTPFVTEKGNEGSCNYDFNLYDNSIFLIDKVVPIANLYGLAAKQGAFLASSSQKLGKIVSLRGLPLFKGESKVRSSAVCLIENKGNSIWTFSNLSRDPGQHLFHLVRYGLPATSSTADVDRLIRHSRHLFLSDPVRLIIESARSSEEQIENLLKLNLPIYNADKLGNIWAYTHFREGNRFIIDDRNTGAFRCEE